MARWWWIAHRSWPAGSSSSRSSGNSSSSSRAQYDLARSGRRGSSSSSSSSRLTELKWWTVASLFFFFGCPFFLRAPQPDCQYTAGFELHRCAMGYAQTAGVHGGYYSPRYVVTSSEDSLDSVREGTLRWGISNYRQGVYITFNASMTIHLRQRLFLASHTTIDGGGLRVRLLGAGIVLQNVTHVVLYNLEVGNQPGDHDVIPIRSSQVVWVDHCRVHDGKRGTIDVVYNSTDVTVSNCRLHNHNLTMLLGAEDSDEYDADMRVTVYRNWFDRSGQRQPHCRWGRCHVANNLYTDWAYYCLGGRAHANIRSDKNIFRAGNGRKEVTPWFGDISLTTAGFDNSSTIRSFGDLLLNGATFHEFSGTHEPFSPPYGLDYYEPGPAMESFVRQSAGPQYPWKFLRDLW